MSGRTPTPRYGGNQPPNNQYQTFDYVDPAWITAGNVGPLPQYEWNAVITANSAEQSNQSEEGQLDNSEQLSLSGSSLWCPRCSLRFHTRWDLTTHLGTHLFPLPCIEKTCTATFSSEHERLYHMSHAHPVSVWGCPWRRCTFWLNQRGLWTELKEKHMRDVHNGELPSNPF
ncbi:hypothetical protein B0T10DRAFT_465971 [Thelonectria olida]|uniref:C2H2-type domain-containing protein n=1 Tax=Thelonectria olida TaxID=1576542 RepID=A0A9P8VTX3_9HYPO|nr:hypothetical protein B0T10DRAFT_465971 [Thelonectria olida]